MTCSFTRLDDEPTLKLNRALTSPVDPLVRRVDISLISLRAKQSALKYVELCRTWKKENEKCGFGRDKLLGSILAGWHLQLCLPQGCRELDLAILNRPITYADKNAHPAFPVAAFSCVTISRDLQQKCSEHRRPFGKIDGPGKWNKPHLNQGPLFC